MIKAIVVFICLFLAAVIVAFTIGVESDRSDSPERLRALRIAKSVANSQPNGWNMRDLIYYKDAGILIPGDTIMADDSVAMITVSQHENGVSIGWSRVGDKFREGEGMSVNWIRKATVADSAMFKDTAGVDSSWVNVAHVQGKEVSDE